MNLLELPCSLLISLTGNSKHRVNLYLTSKTKCN